MHRWWKPIHLLGQVHILLSSHPCIHIHVHAPCPLCSGGIICRTDMCSSILPGLLADLLEFGLGADEGRDVREPLQQWAIECVRSSDFRGDSCRDRLGRPGRGLAHSPLGRLAWRGCAWVCPRMWGMQSGDHCGCCDVWCGGAGVPGGGVGLLRLCVLQ